MVNIRLGYQASIISGTKMIKIKYGVRNEDSTYDNDRRYYSGQKTSLVFIRKRNHSSRLYTKYNNRLGWWMRPIKEYI